MTATFIRKPTVFVDTSAFYALRDPDDAHHASAVAAFLRLERERAILSTTDHVMGEAATLIRAKLGFSTARSFLLAIQESRAVGLLELQSPGWDDMEAAIAEFLRWSGPRFSFVDALSFVVCRRLGITRALAFDDDFRAAGLEVISP